jgi:hypothetical protein
LQETQPTESSRQIRSVGGYAKSSSLTWGRRDRRHRSFALLRLFGVEFGKGDVVLDILCGQSLTSTQPLPTFKHGEVIRLLLSVSVGTSIAATIIIEDGAFFIHRVVCDSLSPSMLPLEPLACRLLHLQGLGDIFKASLECGIVRVLFVISALVQIWAKWYTTALTSDDGIQCFLAPSSDSFVCLRSQTLDLIFSTQAMT